ncbi:MAG: hypothetical protein QRY74_01140 [Chlamydia sp.]
MPISIFNKAAQCIDLLVYKTSKEVQEFTNEYQQNLPPLDNKDSAPIASNDTTVTVGLDHKEIPLDKLLGFINLDIQKKETKNLEEIKKNVQKSSEERKVYDELLGKLSETLSDEDRKSKSISLIDYRDLARLLKEARVYIKDSKLLKKIDLSEREIDSLIKLLQHKSSGIQQDLKQHSDEMQIAVERFNTIARELLQILKTLREISRSLIK